MTTSIVIINWNGKSKLEKYLPEILKVKQVDEFIVTDDKSSDESVKFIEENYPQIKLVKRASNGGFSANANTGVKSATTDLVFLLNPDAVPDSDCVIKAKDYFKDEKVFSVGCNTGGNWSWAKFEKGFFWHFMSQEKQETHQTLWARGGSGIFRKSIWEKLDGRDELFNPFYEEDTDLGYRATKRGYINIWAKDCEVRLPKEEGVIEQNFSKTKFSSVAQRNQLLFIWKNITSEDLLGLHQTTLLKMLLTKPKYWTIFLSALICLPDLLKKRGIEKRDQKLTDEELLSKYQG